MMIRDLPSLGRINILWLDYVVHFVVIVWLQEAISYSHWWKVKLVGGPLKMRELVEEG